MRIRFITAAALLAAVGVGGEPQRVPQAGRAGDSEKVALQGYDVRAFGAKGDGKTLDTDAINSAIAAAHAAGGGTVRFVAGTYLSTSIRLQSHVGLFLDHGSTIVAADPAAGPYDEPEPNEWDKFLDGTYKRTVKYNRGPTGRIKFGTESNGGFKNVTISNCVFEYSRGLAIDSLSSPLFGLRKVTEFLLRNSPGLPDKRLTTAEKESF